MKLLSLAVSVLVVYLPRIQHPEGAHPGTRSSSIFPGGVCAFQWRLSARRVRQSFCHKALQSPQAQIRSVDYPYEEDLASKTIKGLGVIHDQNGTQGVLQWCRGNPPWRTTTKVINESSSSGSLSPRDWRNAILDLSVPNNKGKACGILNALVGSCCLVDDGKGSKDSWEAARFALDLMNAWNTSATQANSHFRPDLVTYALAYRATKGHFPTEAANLLRCAELLHPNKETPSHTHNPTAQQWRNRLEDEFLISVVHDEDDYCVLNKPSGMALACSAYALSSGRTFKSKLPRNMHSRSLEDILFEVGLSLSSMNPDGLRGFVHRLDAGTSGCLVVAKTDAAHAMWITHFFLREVTKSYQCLVDTSILMGHKEQSAFAKAGVVDMAIEGRLAQSTYEVLEQLHPLVAQLRVRTLQGRKHQVRIHCSRGLQTPILLDPRYGGERIMFQAQKSQHLPRNRALGRFCLHADSLVVNACGHNISVQATTPLWWDDVLDDICFVCKTNNDHL